MIELERRVVLVEHNARPEPQHRTPPLRPRQPAQNGISLLSLRCPPPTVARAESPPHDADGMAEGSER